MINDDILINNGYKKYNEIVSFGTKTLYQKTAYDLDGTIKLYFINVYHSTYQVHDTMYESWELHMFFDRDSDFSDYCWLNFKLNPEKTVIQDLEKLTRTVWESNNGLPYES